MDDPFIPFMVGSVVGLSTLWLPSWFYLRNEPRLDGRKLERRHKNKNYVRWAIPLSFLLLFVIFCVAFLRKSPTHSPTDIFYLVVLFASLNSLIIGIFELVSGVSVNLRRYSSEREYIVSGAVREAGRFRVVYTLLVIALSYGIMHLIW